MQIRARRRYAFDLVGAGRTVNAKQFVVISHSSRTLFETGTESLTHKAHRSERLRVVHASWSEHSHRANVFTLNYNR